MSSAASRLLSAAELKDLVAVVPDFPKPGISFKDVTPIFADPVALRSAIALLREQVEEATDGADLVVGAEARGFVLGAALARELRAGFIPTRKPGKLPRATHSVEYGLEYGTDSLQMHRDAIASGQRVVIHDDLIATGGTAAASARMVEELGGEIVAFSFLVELRGLGGRRLLPGSPPVLSLIEFDQ
jgi:adenine phosphoribosyltransferase